MCAQILSLPFPTITFPNKSRVNSPVPAKETLKAAVAYEQGEDAGNVRFYLTKANIPSAICRGEGTLFRYKQERF